jgi:hypothetical protein
MFESFKVLPLLGLAACAATGAAQAQWFPPFGATPAGAIVQRLHAQGYTLIRPLRRNQTVYLAYVNAGIGRERLVIDAFSGEILQRFVATPRPLGPGFGGYIVEGGEFSAPPPLGRPPMRDFYSPPSNFAYGAPSDVGIPWSVAPVGPRNAKPKLRPHKPAEMKHARLSPPSEQAARPPEADATRAGNPPPTNAAPAATATPSGSPPAAPTATQVKNIVAPQPAAAAPPAERGSSDKSKVNDVPVNPLE